jgi:CRP-like cAMP-binding protein
MIDEAQAQLLKKAELFSDLSEDRLAQVARYFEWTLVDKGQVLIREGDDSGFAILVVSGCFEVIKGVGGSQKLLSIAKPGAFLGELGLISGDPRYATCRAAEDSVVGFLSRENFVRMMTESTKTYSEILAKLCHVMGRRLVHVNDTVLRLQETKTIAVSAAKQILENALQGA